ncbi:hypothetical protein [Anaerotruncus colihominis]|nr:hypothetical protein [Anaerotruncus colihominis]
MAYLFFKKGKKFFGIPFFKKGMKFFAEALLQKGWKAGMNKEKNGKDNAI